MEYINYLISENNESHNHAGSKARNDVEYILTNIGCTLLKVSKFSRPKDSFDKLKIIFKMTFDWIKVFFCIKKNSNLIIQYPLESPRELVYLYLKNIKRIKKVNLIAIIHDLESLRFDQKSKIDEIRYLQEYDYVIAHNESMSNYLISNGISGSRIKNIKIFDYLTSCSSINKRKLSKEIIIAGNLSQDKSEYIYKLHNVQGDVKFNLFGPNYCGDSSKNIEYYGQFLSEELPGKMKGSFGLVWDGEEISTCSGKTGEYLKYNNPHKLSLYLTSNIPVIVWSRSALAEFVERENIGILIDSIDDIDYKIKHMTEMDYENMIKNTKSISSKLKSGFYLETVVKSIIVK